MAKLKISARELRALGFPEGPAISVTMNLLYRNYKQENRQEVLAVLQKLLAAPADYLHDSEWSGVAQKLVAPLPPAGMELSLNREGVPFAIFGREHNRGRIQNTVFRIQKRR